MKITATEEYGLRCVVSLATGTRTKPLTIAEIAASEGLSVPHVGKLMSILRESGLVESVRGRSGGYVLTRPPSEITVQEVLAALGEPLFSTAYCESHPGSLNVCAHHGGCSIRSVWQLLGGMIHDVLRSTSVADLCMQEAQLAKRLAGVSHPGELLEIVGQGTGARAAEAPCLTTPSK
jgi:Rrf2 family iron-sulfur cluster assembly transcriptional regulator